MNGSVKRVLMVLTIGGAAAVWQSGAALAQRYSFGVNETESLPNWAFITDHANRKPARGDLVDFVAPTNPYYPSGSHFVKIAYGIPGDLVEQRGRDFYVAGRFVGHAKAISRTGRMANLGPAGILPPDHYFLGTPHVDGFDSRYAEIGWVPGSAVVGIARPIL